jgi:hypothetical protein
MKKIVRGCMMVISVSLMSCGASDSPEVDKSIMPAETGSPSVSSLAADSSQPVKVLNAVDGSIPVSTTSPAKPAPAINTGGSSAPNPAHGQPGHRCDIAVGAPLNSPATSPAQPQVQTVSSSQAPVVVTPAAAAPGVPGAKLNPAHGQPGHDCSIAVGAPLKKN